MDLTIDELKKILVEGSYLSKEESAQAEAASSDGKEYVNFLVNQELLTKELLGQAIAEAYKVPFLDLDESPTTKEEIVTIPEAIARQNRIIALSHTNRAITVASDTPQALDMPKLEKLFSRKIHVVYSLPEQVDASFALYEQPIETRFSEIIAEGRSVAPEIVDEIIHDALRSNASDIHFEAQQDEMIVRFRVDGILRKAGAIPKEYYENVLNRIKVESGMRIDEHATAQDGVMHRTTESTSVDLRVSLVPTVEGEKVVMRVLNSGVQGFALGDIGMTDLHRDLLEQYAAKPFGMILTVGPTGSGKTTTLYSLLKLLNRAKSNVTTIEDPVEYKMKGVNQIQVNEASNLTFARGLRAIVRQDPDVILVGEIRDQETAEISVNAALTGHLLLSTFHANDAATAIPRLVDMGIEPFLLSSTLEVIIAQRLSRRICNKCRYSMSLAEAIASLEPRQVKIAQQYFKKTETVYAGKGCAVCSGTGYMGRIALFEFIEITPRMKDLIATAPTTQQVIALSRQEGSISMFDDGIQKIKQGETTLEELFRVVEPPKEMTTKQKA